MAAKRKWNPQTGRFELQGDNGAGDMLNNAFTGTPTATTTPKPKASKPNQGPVAPSTTAPKQTTTTTTPKPTTTTVAPKPKASKPNQGPVAPKKTQPAGPSFRQGEQASNVAYDKWSTDQFMTGLRDLFGKNFDINTLAALLGSGGTGASSAASKYAYQLALENAKGANAIAQGKAGYEGGMAAAQAEEAAGQQAKALYDQLASSGYTEQMKGISDRFTPQYDAMKQYYTGQSTAAQKQINDAAQVALTGMVNPTAYQGLQSALLSAPTQNLGLGTYGATGQLAQQQGELDANTAKFLSDLVNRGYQQTQAANTDYNTALKNAVTGTQSANLQGLTNLITGLQAQDNAGIRQAQQGQELQAQDARQQMLLEGIKALLQGQTSAAGTRASTLANYGAYAPK